MPVPPAMRRAQILERLQREGGVSLTELARELGVSAVTIHRDVTQLAEQGQVERVYGGVVATSSNGDAPAIPPTGWEQRTAQAGPAKRAIAAYAARQVLPGATIFLDSSSTCLALARELVAGSVSGLTLVTNSPAIAYELVDDRIVVVAVPGELDQHMRMFAGRWTTDFMAGLNFDVAFVSAAGLTLDAGLTTSRRPLADVINTARANAERTVALIDSTKFGRASLLTIAGAQDFDTVITDAELDAGVAAEFRAAGVLLEVAG
ncbi:DeoR/GlpR family DNA-binding transcription regulator [Solirubrobacter phytolaccae]|uniref:DeoR/GlpR family DNA-binding transcription regulator n=1 Tax=Solirubrobacter phytolaccae TaxID=1404360 RepID=A0A9X3N573_9ACTN|nr:DeoR/GlpR family DNA-binding transcription regulator [Solirubrobacter phytolaccae]MDA0180115.1 DeoR/GlpR family DNA-binding transcription regulator [Solirubrobacter phytolaccae]